MCENFWITLVRFWIRFFLLVGRSSRQGKKPQRTLPIDGCGGGRRDEYVPFPKTLDRSEKQTALSRFRTELQSSFTATIAITCLLIHTYIHTINSPTLSLSLSLFLCHSQFPSFSFSFCLYICVCVCVCVCVYRLSLSLTLSLYTHKHIDTHIHTHTHTHTHTHIYIYI